MMTANLAECRVGIIGLGLMGGSIALELRDRCRSIAGYDIDPTVLQQALDRGLIDAPIDLASRIDAIDLVILAAPVGAILDWIPRLPAVFPGAFHVIDLGSTKALIVQALGRLPDRIGVLGGHPMCGKETSGLASADKDLFRDRLFVLTPLERTAPVTLSIAHQLIEAIGARPLLLDAGRHDRLAAAISHLPYLTSIALVAAAEVEDEQVWTLAASGFRDSTRLAASDVTMLLDILLSNRPAVLDGLARTQRALQELAAFIEQNDRPHLREQLTAIRAQRLELNSRTFQPTMVDRIK